MNLTWDPFFWLLPGHKGVPAAPVCYGTRLRSTPAVPLHSGGLSSHLLAYRPGFDRCADFPLVCDPIVALIFLWFATQKRTFDESREWPSFGLARPCFGWEKRTSRDLGNFLAWCGPRATFDIHPATSATFLDQKRVFFGLGRLVAMSRRGAGVPARSKELAWVSKRLKTFGTSMCVVFNTTETRLKIWGINNPRFSGFFCQTTLDGAGDVVGGWIDGLPLIYQLD